MANEVRRRGNAGNTGSTGNTADGAPSTSAIANASAPPLSASATSPPPSSLTDKQRLAEFKRRQQQQRTLTSSSTTTSSSSPTSTVTSRNRHRTPRILWFLGLTIASLITRFAYLHRPDQVVFDEVHFGKFGSFYLRREFYFDVHPPLGKMLVALSGWLAGYDGHYLFDEIGDSYPDNGVPYIAMRAFPAILGAMLVPMVYLILLKTNHSVAAAVLGAGMVLFDNALVAHSRLILLDAYLLFFDVLSVLTWVMFYRERHQPYTRRWWMWLAATGLAIACTTGYHIVSCVKMVGLFIVALVGLSTLQDLWRLMDLRRGLDLEEVFLHFASRVFTLIVLPFVVYLALFAVHFSLLTKSGKQDNFMPPAFQATLEGSRLAVPSEAVYYGSNITILHHKLSTYLHSHPDRYPLRYEDQRVSSEGQQVTGYGHSDLNNIWVLLPADGEITTVDGEGKPAPRFWTHGDKFHLEHFMTKKRLLTHDVASPLTTTNTEFTCVDVGVRTNETVFTLELDKPDEKVVNTVDTQFRMIHDMLNVAVHMQKGKLPEWGFGQLEVNGNKNTNPADGVNSWVVESHTGSMGVKKVRSGEEQDKRGPSFLENFAQLQAVMLRENAALVAPHPFQSLPHTWPLMDRGISFWINDATKAQIYFVGNLVEWIVGFVCVWMLVAALIVDQLFLRRGVSVMREDIRRKLQSTGGFFLAGYALHYLPFFIMGRALFIHHYLPALIFSFMVTASTLDLFTARFPRLRMLIVAVCLMAFCAVFIHFAPFTYGFGLEPEAVRARQWRSSWDFQYVK